MPYCTKADILEQMENDVLIQLTDDEDAGVVDDDKVTRAIANADAEIDSYCGTKYTVPFTTVPPIILMVSVDIAIYNLYSRRRGAPESIKERYDDRIAFLKSVSKGEATLGEDDPDGTPAGTNYPEISSSDRIFSREKLKGW